MHSLTHRIVATESKREVRHSATNLCVGQILLDPARGLDEIHAIAIVLLDTRSHCQNIGIENYILGRETFIGQYLICALGNLHLTLVGIGLTALIEQHHNRRRTITSELAGVLAQHLLALFERDRIDHAFALRATQSCRQHLPFRRVDHHRHTCNLRLGSRQIQELAHRLLGVDHSVVHTYVNHLRSRLNLRTCYRHRLLEVALAHQTRKLSRASYIRALANVDKVRLWHHTQLLQTAQCADMRLLALRARSISRYNLREFENMFGRCTATTTHNIDQSTTQILLDIARKHLRRLVVATHHIRKTRIGVCRHSALAHLGQTLQVRQHLTRTVGTIQTHRQRLGVRHRGIERLDRLSRQRATTCVS